MLHFLFTAATGEAAPSLFGAMGSMLPMLIIMVVMIVFVMILPERKKKKEAEALKESLRKGDQITTIGGIVGKIVNIKDDKIVIETSEDQVRLELTKWAVMTNHTAEKNKEKRAAEAKDAAQKRKDELAKEKAQRKAKKDGLN